MTPRYQPEGATSEMSGVDGGHHAAVTSSPTFRRGFRVCCCFMLGMLGWVLWLVVDKSRAVIAWLLFLNEMREFSASGFVVPLSSTVSVLLFGGHRAAHR